MPTEMQIAATASAQVSHAEPLDAVVAGVGDKDVSRRGDGNATGIIELSHLPSRRSERGDERAIGGKLGNATRTVFANENGAVRGDASPNGAFRQPGSTPGLPMTPRRFPWVSNRWTRLLPVSTTYREPSAPISMAMARLNWPGLSPKVPHCRRNRPWASVT